MAFTPNPSTVRSVADALANANAALYSGYDEARHTGDEGAAKVAYDAWKGHRTIFAGKNPVEIFKGVAAILEGHAPQTREAWRKLAAEYYYNVEVKGKSQGSTALAKGQKFQASDMAKPAKSAQWWVWPAIGVGGVAVVGILFWALGGPSSKPETAKKEA